MSKETRTRHRNPLFDPALGITHRLFADDTLHCVYLSVCGFFVQTALWLLLTANVFNIKGPQAVIDEESVMHLRPTAQLSHTRKSDTSSSLAKHWSGCSTNSTSLRFGSASSPNKQAIYDGAKKYLQQAKLGGVPDKPKNHQFLHMVHSIQFRQPEFFHHVFRRGSEPCPCCYRSGSPPSQLGGSLPELVDED